MFGFGIFDVEKTMFNQVQETSMFSRPDSMVSYWFANPVVPELASYLQPARNTGDRFLKKYWEVL